MGEQRAGRLAVEGNPHWSKTATRDGGKPQHLEQDIPPSLPPSLLPSHSPG
jgi:hypothetical protein